MSGCHEAVCRRIGVRLVKTKWRESVYLWISPPPPRPGGVTIWVGRKWKNLLYPKQGKLKDGPVHRITRLWNAWNVTCSPRANDQGVSVCGNRGTLNCFLKQQRLATERSVISRKNGHSFVGFCAVVNIRRCWGNLLAVRPFNLRS